MRHVCMAHQNLQGGVRGSAWWDERPHRDEVSLKEWMVLHVEKKAFWVEGPAWTHLMELGIGSILEPHWLSSKGSKPHPQISTWFLQGKIFLSCPQPIMRLLSLSFSSTVGGCWMVGVCSWWVTQGQQLRSGWPQSLALRAAGLSLWTRLPPHLSSRPLHLHPL